jgi:ribosomal protein L28
MSAHCEVTGRSPGFGNTVSHSHRRARRRWNPNIQTKTYFLPSEGRRNDPDRLVLRKYDPVARRHVDFREER